MKVSELRIGNLVKHASSGKTCIVDEIHNAGAMTSYLSEKGSVTAGIQFFEPIPITAEWLERLGFNFSPPINSWVKDSHRIYTSDTNGIYVFNMFSIHDADSYIEFQCVHQLQNLFFALTGEELTLKTQ